MRRYFAAYRGETFCLLGWKPVVQWGDLTHFFQVECVKPLPSGRRCGHRLNANQHLHQIHHDAAKHPHHDYNLPKVTSLS